MIGTGIKWLAAFVVCLLITDYFHSGKKINGVIWSDQEGYYIYLPALFVNGGFTDLPCVNGCTFIDSPNGKQTFTKYTYGVSLLESPFFLMAHAVAPWLGYTRDGRSLPYIWAVMTAAIFYMLIGLRLVLKLLSELGYDQRISWLIPVGILLGTNLFYYTFREAGMSHVYSFFLFSLLIYAEHRKSLSRELIWNAFSGISLALIILIRPTNAIAILIPLLWGADFKHVSSRIKEFFSNWRWWTIFGVALVVLFLPQLLYWKALTGNFLFYSYGDEGFSNWMAPKMLQVLFSAQNGWLVYSPAALIGIAGMGLMLKDKVQGTILPIVLLTIATYVFGSWWAWWFGGAYGHRCYVELLPLLAVPSAYAVSRINTYSKWMKTGIATMIFIAVFINIRMSDIYHGMWDGPNWGWTNYFQKLAQVFYC